MHHNNLGNKGGNTVTMAMRDTTVATMVMAHTHSHSPLVHQQLDLFHGAAQNAVPIEHVHHKASPYARPLRQAAKPHTTNEGGGQLEGVQGVHTCAAHVGIAARVRPGITVFSGRVRPLRGERGVNTRHTHQG